MGNYEELKSAIASVIKTNGKQEITGQVLQNTLTTLISQVGANATFAGIATPDTSPGTPDQKVFYISGQSGVYANFGGVNIGEDEVYVFVNNSGVWVAKKTNLATANSISKLEAKNASVSGVVKGIVFDNNKKTITNNGIDALVFGNGAKTELVPFTSIEYGTLRGDMGFAALVYKDGVVKTELLKFCGVDSIILTVFRVRLGAKVTPLLFEYEVERVLDSYIPYTIIEGGRLLQSDNLMHQRSLMSLIDNSVVDLSSLRVYNYTLTPNLQPHAGSHYRIDVVPGMVLKIKSTPNNVSMYTFLKNCDDLVVVDGVSRYLIPKGEHRIIVVPNGCYGVFITKISGDNTDISPSLVEFVHMADYIYGVNLPSLPLYATTLGSAGWYSPGSHKVIDVKDGEELILHLENLGTYTVAFYGWLTEHRSNYVSGNAIPYVAGTSRISVSPGEKRYVTAPPTAKYLCISIVDGASNNLQWEVTKSDSIKGGIDFAEEGINNIEKKINDDIMGGNLPSLPLYATTLGSAGWYSPGSHKVIDVKDGEELILHLKNLGTYTAAFYGWLTEHRSNYVSGNAIPYVAGTSRISVSPGEKRYVTAPPTAKYLCISIVDGASNNLQWEVTKSDSIKGKVIENEEEVGIVKQYYINSAKSVFCIMSYNVGQWYNGSGTVVPDDMAEEYTKIQKDIIERYNPDILCLQEYTTKVNNRLNFDPKKRYNYYYLFPSNNVYNGKAICTKDVSFDFSNGNYTNSDALGRNYIKGYIYLNGKKVLIVSTHLSLDLAHRKLELEELLSIVRTEEYCILCMDSNQESSNPDSDGYRETFGLFVDAGYKVLNKDIVTYPSNSECIDNIIVSNNINVKSIFADKQKQILGNNADHYPLVSYLEIF